VLIVKQWGRSQYPTEVLTRLGAAIADAIPGAQQLNIQLEFRKRMDVPGSEGEHTFSPKRNLHVITLDKRLLDQSNLEYVCEVIAHEIGHAIQHTSGQLQTPRGRNGWLWEGQFVPPDTRWEARPHELDALAYEHYGTHVFNTLAQTIPKSAQQQRLEEMEREHPQHFRQCKITMGDLPDDLTRDQLMAAIEIMKDNPNVSLDEVLTQVGSA
jgi:predicted SprT family Zn-dependent metalloprotease